LLVAVPAATPAVGTDSTQLRNAVTVAGIKGHLAQFQDFAEDSIADVGHATRVDDTVGFTESVQYVKQQAEAAGYQVTVQNFTFDRFEETAPPVLERVSPSSHTYTPDTDFSTMEYSGSGNVTAPLAAAGGIVIPSPGGSTSGRAASDFAGFPGGAIALIQRGTCTFRLKSENAAAAGAVGVIIFNEGNTADRQGAINGTLSPPQFSLPVVGASFAVGAHLDSVEAGPGANDNASGSAAVLELARVFASRPERERLSFVLFGAEEWGLWGSRRYVERIGEAEARRLRAMVNLDMVAVGDRFEIGAAGERSRDLQRRGLDAAAALGYRAGPFDAGGSSDHAPFGAAGVPAVMFHWREDPNYHQPTDTVDKLDPEKLAASARTVARLLEGLLAPSAPNP
jgi:aminopeptidase Y